MPQQSVRMLLLLLLLLMRMLLLVTQLRCRTECIKTWAVGGTWWVASTDALGGGACVP